MIGGWEKEKKEKVKKFHKCVCSSFGRVIREEPLKTSFPYS